MEIAAGKRLASFLLLTSALCLGLNAEETKYDYESEDFEEFEEYFDEKVRQAEEDEKNGDSEITIEIITRVAFELQLLKDRPARDCVEYGNVLHPAKKCDYEKLWVKEVTQEYGTLDDMQYDDGRELKSCPLKFSRCYFLLNNPTTDRSDARRQCSARGGRLANVYSKELFLKLKELMGKTWKWSNVTELYYWTGGEFDATRGSRYYTEVQGEFDDDHGINWPIWPSNDILKTGLFIDDGGRDWMIHETYEHKGPAPWFSGYPKYNGQWETKYTPWSSVYVKAVRDLNGRGDKMAEAGLVNVPTKTPQNIKFPFYSICEYDVNPGFDELEEGKGADDQRQFAIRHLTGDEVGTDY